MFIFSSDLLIKLLDLFSNLKLSSIYGKSCVFWLCPSLRRILRAFTTIMAIYASGSAKNSLKCVWNKDYRGAVLSNLAHNANIQFVKSFWSLTEYSFIRDAFPNIMFGNCKTKIAKDLIIKSRQDKYVIPLSGERVKIKPQNENELNKSEIKCRLIINKIDPSSNTTTILLHCHGGGFVSQSPNSHEVYLRDWSKQLPDIPIISIDYILSPEGKYPQALQQVLDAYIWLIDPTNEEIKQTIGFNPTQVLLCGDSAGGNLMTALCLVLNDIRLYCHYNIQMPKSLLCIYTPLILKLCLSPSRIMTAFDALIPIGVLLACLEAYVDINEQDLEKSSKQTATVTNSLKPPKPANSPVKSDTDDEYSDDDLFKFTQLEFLSEKEKSDEEDALTEDEFVIIDREDTQPQQEINFEFPNDFSVKFQQKYYSTLNQIKKSFYTNSFANSWSSASEKIVPSSATEETTEPWYKAKDNKLKKKITLINNKCTLPYISPLLYSNFSSLADVSLHLVAATYDVCLDDSIAMAKKWTGPVTLDICHNLPHGFLNFIVFSDEAKQGSDLIVNRIKQTLNID